MNLVAPSTASTMNPGVTVDMNKEDDRIYFKDYENIYFRKTEKSKFGIKGQEKKNVGYSKPNKLACCVGCWLVI